MSTKPNVNQPNVIKKPRGQNLTEEEKNKKREYGREPYKNLRETEKTKAN